MQITKIAQMEKDLPNWFMEMFCQFDWHRQVWVVDFKKLYQRS